MKKLYPTNTLSPIPQAQFENFSCASLGKKSSNFFSQQDQHILLTLCKGTLTTLSEPIHTYTVQCIYNYTYVGQRYRGWSCVEDTPMGPEQTRSKMVSLQDFDLIRVSESRAPPKPVRRIRIQAKSDTDPDPGKKAFGTGTRKVIKI